MTPKPKHVKGKHAAQEKHAALNAACHACTFVAPFAVETKLTASREFPSLYKYCVWGMEFP